MRDTSVQAFRDVEKDGTIARQQGIILSYLSGASCPQTASEIEAIVHIKAHKRMAELERINKVKVCDKRKCSITGRTAITYSIFEDADGQQRLF